MSKRLTQQEVVMLHNTLIKVLNFESNKIDSKLTTSNNDNDYSVSLTLWYKDTNTIDVFHHKMEIIKTLETYKLNCILTLWGYTKERIAISIPDDTDIQALCGILLLRNQ